MEWIDGVKLTDKPKMDAAGLNIIDFVDVGIECTLRQLLEHGYFHADPHPGKALSPQLHPLAPAPLPRGAKQLAPSSPLAPPGAGQTIRFVFQPPGCPGPKQSVICEGVALWRGGAEASPLPWLVCLPF